MVGTGRLLGDFLFTTVALSYLMHHYPDGKITVACAQAFFPLLASLPGVERFIPSDPLAYKAHWLNLWKAVRRDAWQEVIDFRGSILSYMLSVEKRKIWNTQRASDFPSLHRSEAICRWLGMEHAVLPQVWLAEEHYAQAAHIFGEDPRPVILLVPFASSYAKRWPMAYFEEVVNILDSHFKGDIRFMIRATVNERPFLAHLEKDPRFLIPPSEIDLGCVAACIQRTSLCIGIDSGISHLAATVGIPTLTLFGPSCPVQFRPFGKGPSRILCSPSGSQERTAYVDDKESLLKDLLPQEVAHCAIDFLSSLPPSAARIEHPTPSQKGSA